MRILRSKKTIALAAAALAAAVLATAGLSGVWAQVTHADTVGGIHLRVFSTSVSGFDSGWQAWRAHAGATKGGNKTRRDEPRLTRSFSATCRPLQGKREISREPARDAEGSSGSGSLGSKS